MLREIIASRLDWELTGEAENGETAIALAIAHHPDVILMDVAMPEINGLQATRLIKMQAPDIKIVLFSAYGNRSFHQGSKEAGADFFVPKEKITAKVLDEILNKILTD